MVCPRLIETSNGGSNSSGSARSDPDLASRGVGLRRHRDRLRGAIAHERDLDRGAGLEVGDAGDDVVARVDRLAVDGDDLVAGLRRSSCRPGCRDGLLTFRWRASMPASRPRDDRRLLRVQHLRVFCAGPADALVRRLDDVTRYDDLVGLRPGLIEDLRQPDVVVGAGLRHGREPELPLGRVLLPGGPRW